MVGIGWLTMVFANADPTALFPRIGPQFLSGQGSRLEHEAVRAASALAVAAVILIVGMGWSLLFWFESADGRTIALFPTRSALGPLVLVHGAFVMCSFHTCSTVAVIFSTPV